MAERLETPDGVTLPVDPVGDAEQEFKRAMAAPEPSDPPAAAPPPKDPEAPYGRRADGTPKKGPGGRPPKPSKAEKPRVQSARSAQVGKDYTEPLTDVMRLGWTVLAATSPADAGALKMHGPGMVVAFAALASENAQVARGIEWISAGSVYGAVAMATLPLLLQVMANHGRLPAERLAAVGVVDPAALAEFTAADVGMMQEAAAAQAAAAAV